MTIEACREGAPADYEPGSPVNIDDAALLRPCDERSAMAQKAIDDLVLRDATQRELAEWRKKAPKLDRLAADLGQRLTEVTGAGDRGRV